MKTLHTVVAFASVALGLLTGAWLWLIPLTGLPVALVGLLMGIFSLKSQRNKAALAGTIFSLIALFLVLVNLSMEYILFGVN